jgi:hypothetical protein
VLQPSGRAALNSGEPLRPSYYQLQSTVETLRLLRCVPENRAVLYLNQLSVSLVPRTVRSEVSTRLCASLPEDGSGTGFPNVVFL